MTCPFCSQTMECGNLYSGRGHAVYWLSNSDDDCITDMAITTKRGVEKRGGIVVDKLTKMGFYPKKRPNSYYCKSCNLLITKLEK